MKYKLEAERPRSLLILGHASNAADLAMRRILHAKERDQPLVVIDYQGLLAAALTNRNKGNLSKSPMLWCDLANRRRPNEMFHFTQSPGMKIALRGFIDQCARHMVVPVSSASIDAVVELAYRMADQGSIGLAALVSSLRRPETAHFLRRDANIGPDVDQLINLLSWALRFPSVWSLSEGNNPVKLDRHLAMGGTIWIEMAGSHFELIEHQLVSWMVDAAITNALLSYKPERPNGQAKPNVPMVLYGFPVACPHPFACSVVAAKHIGIFPFSSNHPLPVAAKQWLDVDPDVWVTGPVGELPVKAKIDWLDDTERLRLKALELGQVWVRSGVDKRVVTTLVRPPEPDVQMARDIRNQSFKRLRSSPVKQFCSALPNQDAQLPLNADLYRSLCDKDALYAGWFRVKAHNRYSHGSDRITIEQFGAMVDTEIAQLVIELTEGRYHCRALRTTRIPKSDGDYRVLKVACVRDRVVQAACLHLIEPLFEVRFSAASFAYRPGRGAHHAVAMVRSAIRCRKHWAIVADIKKCFDSLDHEVILRLLSDVIGDRDLLQLIRQWLAADVIDFMDVIPSELGAPQGEAISPLLANIYLDPMDKEFERAGITFVRYADDYVVLCDSEAETQAALRLMTEFLQGVLRLALKPAKTHYCRVEEGIDFLGFRIGVADVCIPQEKLAATRQVLESLMDNMANSNTTPAEKYNALLGLNARVRGFRNYFSIDNAPSIHTQLLELDDAIDASATTRFAATVGMDAAWQARDRFVPASQDFARQIQTSAEVALLTGAYPTNRSEHRIRSGLSNQFAVLPSGTKVPDAVVDATLLGTADSKQLEDTDVLVIDGRLHVMTSGCYVTVNGDDLVVKKRKHEVSRMPITDLSMVYLEGKGIAVSADLTMRLCDNDVPVVFTPLIGVPAAIAQPVQSTRANIRQQQVLRRNDPDILKMGLRMLAAKVANQASVLKYFARYRKRKDDAVYASLTSSADEIRVIAETLDGFDPTTAGARASAMGQEGRAAAKYWGAFANLVPAELAFPGRHTRHANDCVNSAINYTYGILYGEIWRAVIRNGLDPYFGIMHGTERDQGSLVFDLIEEYRAPFGDRLVLGMLGRGFELVLDKDGRIKAACRRKLVQAFHKLWHRELRWRGKLRSAADILELQVSSIKNSFLGKDEYRPFRFRW